jgi:hypothetical protein
MKTDSVDMPTLSFPALYLNREGWERLGDKLADPFFQRLYEDNEKSLQNLLAAEPRMHSRALKNQLQRAVVGWYISRKEIYLDMAKQALLSGCEHKDLWWFNSDYVEGLRAADLSTGEMLYNVAFGYDALYPYLTKSEKQLCESTLIHEGLAAYLQGIELEDWWVRCDFNWNSALHGNAGLAAMVIRHIDPDLSNHVLKEVLTGLPYMIKSFYPDGGYIEGVMYFNTAIGHLTDFIVPYYRHTGDDLGVLKNQSIHDSITWKLYMWGGDGKPLNFSDVSEYVGKLGLPQLYWWAQQLHHPEWTGDNDMRVGSARGSAGLFHDVESFWYRDAFSPVQQPDKQPLRHFTGIDWVTWHGKHSWLGFRSGLNGGNHDNDDLGTFILGYDGDRFLCDPGYRINNASQHNCVTVREFEQTDCAVAHIDILEPLADGFYLRCDITQAFPLALQHYDRHLLLIDDTHVLLIDDIQCHPAYRTWARSYLQTRLPVQETPTGWCIQGESNLLHVKLLSDTGFRRYDTWTFDRNRDEPINRLSWRDAYDREHTVQVTLLSFQEPQVSCEITSQEIYITVNAYNFAFRLQQGRLQLDMDAMQV